MGAFSEMNENQDLAFHSGIRYRGPGPGYPAPGTRYLVPNRRRGPNTEDRAQP
jgi:hypothetical protein